MLSSVCTLKLCRLRAYYSTGDFFGAPPGCQKVNIMSENQDCGRGKA
jgi:MoaA/NifB/PqqE/SkfB family radical SAM enzyme